MLTKKEPFGRDKMADGGSPLGKVLCQFDFSSDDVPVGLSKQLGKWSVEDGVLTQSARLDKASFASVHVGGQANYRVQARIRMPNPAAGALVGIVARLQPDGSCYMLCLHVREDGRKNIQLWRGQPDAPTPCVTVDAYHPNVLVADSDFIDEVNLQEWQELTMDCHGQHVAGYLDGLPRLS